MQIGELAQVALVDPATGKIAREMQRPHRKDLWGLTVLTFSRDGKLLAAGMASGEAFVWDATTGRLLREIPPQIVPEMTIGPDQRTRLAHAAPVGGLAFAPDGATLAVTAHDLVVSNSLTGQKRPSTWPADARAFFLAATSDGTTLAIAGEFPLPGSGTCRLALVDAASGRIRVCPGVTDSPADLAFLPGGKSLVTLEENHVLRLWDVASARVMATHRFDHHFRLTCLDVSPDGRRIAAGGYSSNWIFGAIALVEVEGNAFKPWHPAP